MCSAEILNGRTKEHFEEDDEDFFSSKETARPKINVNSMDEKFIKGEGKGSRQENPYIRSQA